MACTGQVPVKGVVPHEDRVLLARDERMVWQLPGGRFELRETPRECARTSIVSYVCCLLRGPAGIDTACGPGSRMVKTVRSACE